MSAALKALLRQHLPNPSRYDRVPDPQKPHAMCYLADEAQLVDDKLLTSELTALLVVAADTALKAAWQKQKIIPVTLITGSRRTVRLQLETPVKAKFWLWVKVKVRLKDSE
ncbi:hypothetical protein FOVSG1_007307 [Fusarium oxysporum f. sp. vasinfectum]